MISTTEESCERAVHQLDPGDDNDEGERAAREGVRGRVGRGGGIGDSEDGCGGLKLVDEEELVVGITTCTDSCTCCCSYGCRCPFALLEAAYFCSVEFTMIMLRVTSSTQEYAAKMTIGILKRLMLTRAIPTTETRQRQTDIIRRMTKNQYFARTDGDGESFRTI